MCNLRIPYPFLQKCQEKNAMSTISEKVYVLEDGVKVLPQGHFLISDRVECIEYRKQLGLEKLT